MNLLKVESCEGLIVNNQPFEIFARSITKEMLNDDNECNKVLCSISKGIKQETNPKVYFDDDTGHKIICLEFLAGVEEVLMKVLSYECDERSKKSYLMNLVNDKHRVWTVKRLHFIEDKHIPNQVLTLLRLCKIDKEEFKRDPGVLSQRFSRRK